MSIKKFAIALLVVFICAFKNNDPKPHNLLEKIYTQTDRPLYFPGETIWFKSYVTNAKGTITTLSDQMTAELISPKGNVVQRLELGIQQGYTYGDFYISPNFVGGVYKVRMYTNWMRNYGKDSFFEKEIVIQKVVSPNVLLKLEFEKKAYGKGQEVTADFEAKDLENKVLSQADVSYSINVAGQSHYKGAVKTNLKGEASITFNLPEGLNTTDVLLNVQLLHNGKVEAINRSVPVTLNNIDIQFMPESGNAIVGVKNTIAFKAVNEFGKPADVSGSILDSAGNVVTQFESFHDGMGSFDLTSKTTAYYAKITAPFQSDSLIALPNILVSGTKFHITETDEKYEMEVYSNLDKQLVVAVASSYEDLQTKKIKLNRNRAVYHIKKNELPEGIIKISLKDVNENIVAERLLFNNKPNQIKVSVSLQKRIYKTREKVLVKIHTADSLNNPIPSNLSVSVADNKLVSYADDKQDNIASYLLLSSELQGKIYKPSFYFDAQELKAHKALNYVMLTHGWRSYIQNSIHISSAAFKPVTKDVQYGKVVDKKGNGVESHLLLFDASQEKVIKMKTNVDGSFQLKPNATGKMILLAYTDKGVKVFIKRGKFIKGNDTQIVPDSSNLKYESVKYKSALKPNKSSIKEEVTLSNGKLIGALETDGKSLDEVVVTGAMGISRGELTASSVVVVGYGVSNTSSELTSLLQGKVAGLQISGALGDVNSKKMIAIRGNQSMSLNSPTLFVVDGVVYNNISGLNDIDPDAIKSITIIKGSEAVRLYGSQAGGGVVNISLKGNTGYYNRKRFHSKRYKNYTASTFYFQQPQLYQPKYFEAPHYVDDELPNTRTDFRNTLYWNPVVQTDENGNASFEFYTSDAISSFVITAEGMAYNGIPVRNIAEFATKNTLQTTLTVPNYMAVNDTVQIPITIVNNTDSIMKANVSFMLPHSLASFNCPEEVITIPANGYVITNLPVVPTKRAYKQTIEVAVEANGYTDLVKEEFTTISSYFPKHATLAGSDNKHFQFDMQNVVEGSVLAEFSLYTDVVGTVMDGIDNIIREPHGCFEQVSASTYPNVLVLQYLRETGKSNPDLEKKAMKYIKQGYKKLAGYETAENGFEWFGHTPPHEALSAYGLMEFTEMQNVYDGVDARMLERTKKFLLSRKDEMGGFEQNKGKYGFSAAPYLVNNAYIVYALSESGVPLSAYELQYNTAVQEVIDSNDAYRLALLVCASGNLHKATHHKLLMKRLKDMVATYGFEKLPVESTITRSYGKSKNVETAAFMVMALLKEEGNEYLVSDGVNYIASKRSYGGFGSTQATSMALKALIAYTKTQKEKLLTANAVTLLINGASFTRTLKANNNGKIVIENLEEYILAGKQDVKVSFADTTQVFPYQLLVRWDTTVPDSANQCKVAVTTTLASEVSKIGESVRMEVAVENTTKEPLPMVTAMIGIPSGTQIEPWQLRELTEKQKADYVEVFDNYLVLYWKEFGSAEIKQVSLDLKTLVPGSYNAPASSAYVYYESEHKHWVKGTQLEIKAQ
ncbi:MG2 domain-containing protein [Neptunitalea lumnitzerae]|uniref:Alpha-2-macroglobulin domain-containing protein n=1 Tax=Neptunitalea lumnitzerae TaxID=2965509 RepID=A0ABQ5MEE2_9FLAO|nr:MG2 domain-containing protein [Neptunitalea sp. Y10]GLB47744.1 hypothetical protein Y10_01120 [Neptunitalea sp. Y10]